MDGFEVLGALVVALLGLGVFVGPILSLVGFLRGRELRQTVASLEDTVRSLEGRVEGLARAQARMTVAPAAVPAASPAAAPSPVAQPQPQPQPAAPAPVVSTPVVAAPPPAAPAAPPVVPAAPKPAGLSPSPLPPGHPGHSGVVAPPAAAPPVPPSEPPPIAPTPSLADTLPAAEPAPPPLPAAAARPPRATWPPPPPTGQPGAGAARPPYTPPPPPVEPAAPAVPFDWESMLGVRGAAWLAGITFVIAALFLAKLGYDRGVFTPILRVTAMILAGTGALIWAEIGLRRGYRPAADAISGAGLVSLYAGWYSAHVNHGLIPSPLVTFAAMSVTTLVAAGVSVRHGAVFTSVLGLLGGLATPILLSKNSNNPLGLFIYLAVLNTGFLWVARNAAGRSSPAIALAGTSLMEFGWMATRLDAATLPVAVAALLCSAPSTCGTPSPPPTTRTRPRRTCSASSAGCCRWRCRCCSPPTGASSSSGRGCSVTWSCSPWPPSPSA